jgi:hypothetical protein
MTLATIRTQIQKEIGDRTDINTVIDDQVNFALYEITSTFHIREMEAETTITGVSGTASYSLPSDCHAVIEIWDETNDEPLEEARVNAFDAKNESDTGLCTKWARYANNVILFDDVSDGTQTFGLRYYKRPATLDTDASNHTLPNTFERGIRLLATSYVLRILQQDERADMRMAEFQRWLQQMQTPLQFERRFDKEARITF